MPTYRGGRCLRPLGRLGAGPGPQVCVKLQPPGFLEEELVTLEAGALHG